MVLGQIARFQLLIVLTCLFEMGSAFAAPPSKKLIFAIDGFSFSAFQKARKAGLFPDFNQAGRHIAPYPSMTEPSWTEIMGGKEVFGPKGNVGTIEAKYVDSGTLEIHDDPREVMTRYTAPTSFMRAFDYYLNPVLETMMYFPGDEVIKMELEDLEKEASEKLVDAAHTHAIIYVSEVDAIAHTQKDKLYPLLARLDQVIRKTKANYRAKGIAVETWMISDHGNVGAFQEGESERYLTEVELKSTAKRLGLRVIEAGKLSASNDIAIPVLALGSMGNVYFKDLSRRHTFAAAAASLPFVDLVTWLEVEGRTRSIAILSPSATVGAPPQEARLYFSSAGYSYVPIRGNPLELPASLFSAQGSTKYFSDAQFFEASKNSRFPDAAFRLTQLALKQVMNEPDLVVNLKDGYCFKGNLSALVKMVRTHGSMSSGSSLGLVASDRADARIPSHIRTAQVLNVVGISPQDAFHNVSELFETSSGLMALRKPEAIKKGLLTRMSEYTPDLLFRRFGKILIQTMDWITPDEVRDLEKTAIKDYQKASAESGEAENDSFISTIKKIDFQSAISHLDQIFQLRSLISDEKDPKNISSMVENRIAKTPGLGPLAKLMQSSGGAQSSISAVQVDFFRRSLMKVYSSPYVINEILNFPEGDAVPDVRDHSRAADWFYKGKIAMVNDPDLAFSNKARTQTLFQDIFEERKLIHDLSPVTFPRIYDPNLSKMANLTVVFVPGIYNELFDHEIFSKGLRSLQENLGVRVLYVDVDGRCDSGTNAQMILSQLKADTQLRHDRGYVTPRYMILGYSKGAVDVTEALLLDENFTRNQILGLMSIASPLQGTQIVESTELPPEITRDMILRPLPPACDTHGASRSVSRATREQFWTKNIEKLAKLTRFYSVSFASSVKDSHTWMKLCKTIAKFTGPNDGVVAVEKSKFPEAIRAVDFGTVSGDHLAGILASNFPQEAFLESVMISLYEIGALNSKITERWFQSASQKSDALMVGYYRRTLGQDLLKSMGPIFMAPGPLAAPSGDDPNWYFHTQAVEFALKTPTACRSDAQAKKALDAAIKMLKSTPYAPKDFQINCNKDGSIHVTLETNSSPWYKPWQASTKSQANIRTLGELVDLLLGTGLKSGKNLLEAGLQNLPSIPKSNRPHFVLPNSTFKWSLDQVIDLKTSGKTMGQVSIQPATPAAYPKGLQFIFDQQTTKDFRSEYGFSYESRSPVGMDDNAQGYSAWIDSSSGKDEVVMRMRSKDNSIRLTSSAVRFKVSDFPKFKTRLKVVKGVTGPDSAKGGSGKDDSAFQIWFTLRNLSQVKDRSKLPDGTDVKLFGYYWTDENEKGQMPAAGALLENYFSKKSYMVVTFPESWQIALGGGKASQKKWFNFERNLRDDLKKAYPSVNPDQWEVVSITLQTDSNDTHSESETYLKSFSFETK